MIRHCRILTIFSDPIFCLFHSLELETKNRILEFWGRAFWGWSLCELLGDEKEQIEEKFKLQSPNLRFFRQIKVVKYPPSFWRVFFPKSKLERCQKLQTRKLVKLSTASQKIQNKNLSIVKKFCVFLSDQNDRRTRHILWQPICCRNQ